MRYQPGPEIKEENNDNEDESSRINFLSEFRDSDADIKVEIDEVRHGSCRSEN
jgi:hypothetical protein